MKIIIPKPCHENWETMTPEERGRFCFVCSKTVRDFTVASDEEIINVFSRSSEDICGNFYESQLNRNLQYSYLNSVFVKFAVGFILTTGGLVSVHAQQNITNDTLKTEETKEIVMATFHSRKDYKILGSTTVVSASALNAKENKPGEMVSKVQGVVSNPMPVDNQPIRIGGANSSVRKDQEPLVVMNGKIASLKDLQETDPNAIKAMRILKDAAATSVYGSKAQNGVIIVTTKKKWKMKE
ncbi:TonB-dependent receptor plug domain-containing protein [Chryseobacterium oranimense]|uniref:TonB-dependent receptor plug domain-containing protein n=1 Tax=Chryseobacterium oranimense TaxID=421058 RepID=UPI0021AE4091|nr:TonB-dependent receptor plug domain-containing protein [Chryseobacterium oranimense]UWX61382.1 TonB-dependent receptor plug domain-containing protein [Chryseobacterium oranimense]